MSWNTRLTNKYSFTLCVVIAYSSEQGSADDHCPEQGNGSFAIAKCKACTFHLHSKKSGWKKNY